MWPGCFFFTLVFLLLWERAQGRPCRLGSTLQGRSCTKHGAHEGSRWLQLAPTTCGLLIRVLRALLFCPSLPAEISQELDDEGRVEKCVQAAVVREGTEWEACDERLLIMAQRDCRGQLVTDSSAAPRS